MPQPANVEQFFALLRKSSLLEPDRLDAFLAQQPSLPETPAEAARLLVDQGLLTHFQSEQLSQGKWRGYTIGKYKVLERLGSGGMGSVFLCEHLHMRHKVAVKVLPIAKANDPAALGRFYREARAAGLLDHPNIVRAYDIDQDGELHYLVMDYVDGVNLQRLVTKSTGPLSIARASNYIYQSSLALDHAFRAGLIHRDIKPANLLLDRTGTIKLLDLGLARFYDDHQDLLTIKYDDCNVLGTADYVSPEQAHDSHGVDIRTDIYSLGATFYFLLSGQPLFPDGKVAQKLIWHQTRQPTPIRQLRSDLPAPLTALLEKMIAKRPEERFQTPEDLHLALARWGEVPVAPPADEEIPLLSLAARNAGTGSMDTATRTPASGSPRSGGRGAQPQRKLPAVNSSESNGREFSRAPVVSVSALSDGGGSLHDVTPHPMTSDSPTDRAKQAPSTTSTAAPTTVLRTRWKKLKTAIIVVALLLGASSGVALRLTLTGSTPTPRDHSVLVVDRTGAPDTFGSVRQALEAAQAGDRIELREASWQESLEIDGSKLPPGIMLQGNAPGGRVTWSPPAGHPAGTPLLTLKGVRDLQLDNLAFDGKGAVPALLHVSGAGSGLVLSKLRVQGFRTEGIQLQNCQGSEQHPVTLRQVQLATSAGGEAGVLIQGDREHPSSQVLIEESEFDGPGTIGLVLTGSISQVTVRNNVFRLLDDGVRVRRSLPPGSPSISLVGNLFRDTRIGLHLEQAPPVEGSMLQFRDNRFLRVGQLGQTDGFRPEPTGNPPAWIWAAKGGSRISFRRTFSLARVPTRAVLSLTASDRFTVWVNGQRVGQGGLDGSSRRVPAFEIAGQLQSGQNLIAVEALGRPGSAGLLLELSEHTSGSLNRLLMSDASWVTSDDPGLGWVGQPFDDAAWTPARILVLLGGGEPHWQNLTWESALQEHFRQQANRVFPMPSGNQRDAGSQEGFPLFDASVVPATALEIRKP